MYEGGEAYVRDPAAWKKVGLAFIDNGDYMERLLACDTIPHHDTARHTTPHHDTP